MVVLISGKMGSGKTTLAKALAESFPMRAIRMRFAQPLYEMHDAVRKIADKYGLPVNFAVKDGNLLQLLGTDWGRKYLGNDVWVSALYNQVSKTRPGTIVIIEDCRFKNELSAFAKNPFVLRVRLECDREIRKARAEMWRENENHPSEVDLDGADFDMVIDSGKKSGEEILKDVRWAIIPILSREVEAFGEAAGFALDYPVMP